ncbi:hypothetical protein SteCoe_20094 [Stentor coeruleus]|uniref:RING-CH-type domain-containing protein n=1 Tax=Stentor coeruleus TaxID=5963 RepID=A0A1R2BSR8_9CILI|nr:hypothetical protein SteCoe_20094 [Stentor coeruleus]
MEFNQCKESDLPEDYPKIVIQKVDDDRICRICFDIQIENNPIISPCLCNGTMKYIHEKCLKAWILSQNLEIKGISCDICKALFIIEFNYKTVFSCRSFAEECIKIFVYPFIIFLVSLVLGVVIIHSFEGVLKDTLSLSDKVYLSIIILMCLIMLIILVVVFVNSIKEGCCTKKIISWRIKSNAYHPVEETNITMANENYSKDNQSPSTTAQLISYNGPQFNLDQEIEGLEPSFNANNTEENGRAIHLHEVIFDDKNSYHLNPRLHHANMEI